MKSAPKVSFVDLSAGIAPLEEEYLTAIRNVIREAKTHQLRSLIQQGARDGMATLEKTLSDLVSNGTVSFHDAVAKAVLPKEIRVAA